MNTDGKALDQPAAATFKWYWVSKGWLIIAALACPYVLWGGSQQVSSMKDPPALLKLEEAGFRLFFPGGGRSGRGPRHADFYQNGASVFSADCENVVQLCGPEATFKGNTTYLAKNVQVLEVWEHSGVLKSMDVATPTGEIVSVMNTQADAYIAHVRDEWRKTQLSCLVIAIAATCFFLVMHFKARKQAKGSANPS